MFQGTFLSFVIHGIIHGIRRLPVLLLLFCVFSVSEASDVLVLKSADIKPYLDALEGFKKTCKCDVTELSLHDMGKGAISTNAAAIKANAIFAIGADAFNEALTVKDIPIVYTLVPMLPDNISRQKNIFGVGMSISAEKQLDAIIKIFPSAKKIGSIYDPKNSDEFIDRALTAAEMRGLELVLKKVRKPADVIQAIDAMNGAVDVFWMFPDTTVVNAETVNHLLLFSFTNRVPVFSFSRKYVDRGAVAALSIDPGDLGEQAGDMIKKLLSGSGVKPGIQQEPRKNVLIINRKIAVKLGIRLGSDIQEGAYDDR